MKKVNNFDVLNEMCDRNMDIALANELTNFQRQQKKNGGLVTVGVASPHFDYLINQAATGSKTHQAVLLIYNIEQFKAITKELENK